MPQSTMLTPLLSLHCRFHMPGCLSNPPPGYPTIGHHAKLKAYEWHPFPTSCCSLFASKFSTAITSIDRKRNLQYINF